MVTIVAVTMGSVEDTVAIAVRAVTSVASVASVTSVTSVASVASVSVGSVGIGSHGNSGSDGDLSHRGGDSVAGGGNGVAGVVGSGSGVGSSGSGLVGGDVGAESVAVSDVLDDTDAAVSVGQTVGTNLVAPGVTGLLAERAAAGVGLLVAELVVSVELRF